MPVAPASRFRGHLPVASNWPEATAPSPSDSERMTTPSGLTALIPGQAWLDPRPAPGSSSQYGTSCTWWLWGRSQLEQATEVSGPHGCSGRMATMRASTSGLIWYGHDNGLELWFVLSSTVPFRPNTGFGPLPSPGTGSGQPPSRLDR